HTDRQQRGAGKSDPKMIGAQKNQPASRSHDDTYDWKSPCRPRGLAHQHLASRYDRDPGQQQKGQPEIVQKVETARNILIRSILPRSVVTGLIVVRIGHEDALRSG